MAGLTCLPVTTSVSEAMPTFNDGDEQVSFAAADIVWTEAIASTPEDWVGFWITYENNQAGYVFVAVGAAAFEVKIATLNHQGDLNTRMCIAYVPVAVPAGSRLSVAGVCVSSSKFYSLQFWGEKASDMPNALSFDFMDLGPVNFDGVNNDYAQGVQLAAPAGNNVKSAWTELSFAGTFSTPNNELNGDSLGQDYPFLGLFIHKVASGNVDYAWLIDIAYGSAGNEVPFIENMYMPARTSNFATSASYMPLIFPWGRPAGDRISARWQGQDIATMGAPKIQLIGLR